MLCLITRGSEILSEQLARDLLGRGGHVRLLGLRATGSAQGELGSGADYLQGSLEDAAFVQAACRDVDVVYHLAARRPSPARGLRPTARAMLAAHVRSTGHVLSAAARAGVRKVVYVSSASVYGIPRRHPIDEMHPLDPIGVRGLREVRAEALCAAHLARGLDVSILRPASLFGPRISGIAAFVFERVRQGRPVLIAGPGTNRVDMASPLDVAEACYLAATRPESRGQMFNVGSAGVPTVREQMEVLIAHAGTGSRIVSVSPALMRVAARFLHLTGFAPVRPEHYRLADQSFLLDLSRARRLLGWTPRYDNVEMMTEAYDWYVQTWRPTPPNIIRCLPLLERAARVSLARRRLSD